VAKRLDDVACTVERDRLSMHDEVVASGSKGPCDQLGNDQTGDHFIVLARELSGKWAKDTQDLFGHRLIELTDLEVESESCITLDARPKPPKNLGRHPLSRRDRLECRNRGHRRTAEIFRQP
jgi:hypothetical protein